MKDILKIARIQIIVGIIFVFFKAIRKPVAAKNPGEIIEVFLYSFPNFCEGIIGVLTLTIIGLLLRRWKSFNVVIVYCLAPILASIFVLTQEFKIHNLGGNNIYDPNDVVFSIIGLFVGTLIIIKIKPVIDGPLPFS